MTDSATPAHFDAYVEALRNHDWSFAHSSDMKAYRRGRESLEALRQAQVLLDPDLGLWNRYAPEEHQVHVMPAQTPKPDGGDQ